MDQWTSEDLEKAAMKLKQEGISDRINPYLPKGYIPSDYILKDYQKLVLENLDSLEPGKVMFWPRKAGKENFLNMIKDINKITEQAEEAENKKEKNTMYIFKCFLVRLNNIIKDEQQYTLLDTRYVIANSDCSAEQQALIEWLQTNEPNIGKNVRVIVLVQTEIHASDF